MKHLIPLLEYEEGYREKPYYCSKGYPTIGIGKRIGPCNAPLSHYEFTCSKPMAYMWLDEEVSKIQAQLVQYKWYVDQTESRKVILVSMAYQMGVQGLLGFRNMIKALERKHYTTAFREALDSKWYKRDTPERAMRHATVLQHGDLMKVYRNKINLGD